MNKWKKKIVWLLATAIALAGITNAGVVKNAEAAKTITAKSINMKQSDNSIAGLESPTSTASTAEAWEGNYIYFGTYKGSPIKFRVLNPRETNFGDTTLLLDSDLVLEQMTYGGYGAVWSNSTLKTWMNGTSEGQFLAGFTAAEQNVIVASTKASAVGAGEFPSDRYAYTKLSAVKVFALDASEVNYSGYGYANDATRIKEGGINEYWLRSTNPKLSDASCTVYNDGNIYNYYFANFEKVGASPAMNVDLDAVLLTSAYGTQKADTFNKVETSITNEWKLTVKASDTSLSATTEGATTFYVDQAATDVRSLSITHTAASEALSTANQVSAMLTDAVGNVLYYGKVGDTSATTSTVEITDDLVVGNYNLYVFAEQVNSATATDYASALGTPISIVVESTQNVSKYAVTIVNGSGSGNYEAGATVEIRANMAEAGKQFSKWQVTSGTVVLKEETNPVTTFEMVDSEVTVTAVYEDITETSDTGEHVKLIWIGLAVLLIILLVTLLIFRKRILKKCE